MSSRVFRRIHGKDELEKLHGKIISKGAEHHSDADDPEDDDDAIVVNHSSTHKKNSNLFALAMTTEDGDNTLSENEDGIDVGGVGQERPKDVKPKKKKKKKTKKKKTEDIDVDKLLEKATLDPPTYTDAVSSKNFNPLSVVLRNLNTNNEMKKKFGQKVVGNEGRKKTHKSYKKSTHLVIPKPEWPPIVKSGLEMSIVGQESDRHTFIIEHKLEYQKVQQKFWNAVDSMTPENLMAILRIHPYHIDTLLQLSEVCRMSEDPAMAAELIERALYAFESNFHPLFNLATGKCHLNYQVWENRGLFLAIFQHIHNIGNRGCYRTALEYCKLLLGLDPEMDPLCALLLIDFYALRSDEYQYLIQLYQLWDSSRNLRVLPSFAYSVSLAMFHISEPNSDQRKEADEMLQESLMLFPGVLQPLLDQCGVNTEDDKNINKFFGAHVQHEQPASLKQLVNLYVGRSFSCWKAPQCISWLEENVQLVCTIGLSDPQRFTQLTERGRHLYKGKPPLNVCRHLLMSDIKNATVDLPVDVTANAVLSYDPLPPPDSIKSYERTNQIVRQIENHGFLSAFLHSLRPDFDINAPQNADADEAAVGGAAGLRNDAGNLMRAVRELLNNFEFAPGPRDGGDEDEDQPAQEWD